MSCMHVVTGNGPQLVPSEFREFIQYNAIHQIRSAPYHPASNRQVELDVQTLKQTLKIMQDEPGRFIADVVQRLR